MRILITAGPTQEPIDAVRYIGNRSSGKMGAALAAAAQRGGYQTTLILGPVSISFSTQVRRVDVQTNQQMFEAVMREFPNHDLLIMAAAVADYRPKSAVAGKLARKGKMVLELESTVDIVAEAGRIKRPDQRTVGFSLEAEPDLERARHKLAQKHLDLIVYNPIETIGSDTMTATLLYADGRSESLPSRTKAQVADILIQRAVSLFSTGR